MTSVAFGTATANSNCQISINPKQYLIIYDHALDVPECPNCNEALSTNDCGICTWSSTDK